MAGQLKREKKKTEREKEREREREREREERGREREREREGGEPGDCDLLSRTAKRNFGYLQTSM